MKPNYLKLSEEELEKVRKSRKAWESTRVDKYSLFVAEFGYYYGYEGVQAIRNNEITLDDANDLLKGARLVRKGILYDEGNMAFIAAATARAKKPSTAFKKATKQAAQELKSSVK